MHKTKKNSGSHTKSSHESHNNSGHHTGNTSHHQHPPQAHGVVTHEPSAVPVHDNVDSSEHDHTPAFEVVQALPTTEAEPVTEVLPPSPTTAKVRRAESVRRDEYGNVLVDEPDNYTPINSPATVSRDRRMSRGSFFDVVGRSFRGSAEENHNSTFYRTKSLGIMLVNTVIETTTLPDARIQSKFHSWHRQQLIYLLISNKIELRAEATIPTSSLRELAEELYKGKPTPPKPAPLTKDQLAALEHAALLLQSRWVEKLEQRRLHLADIVMQAYIESHVDDFDYTAEIEAPEGEDTVEIPIDMVEETFMDNSVLAPDRGSVFEGERGPFEPGVDAEMGAIPPALTTPSTARARDHNRGVSFVEIEPQVISEPKRSFFGGIGRSFSSLGSPISKTPKAPKETKTLTYTKSIHVPKKAVEFLDLEWRAPDMKKALKYIDFFHPRKGGKGGLLYDYMKTTTGRHCCLGFLGEQCDILQEGQMSEFAVYGPGVTNYFKFMKWCYWLFVILTAIALPCLLVNFYGPYQFNGGLSQLSVTTAGNLAQSTYNVTDRVKIPICRNYGGYKIDCTMSRYTLGQLYSWSDIIIVSLILLGYLWLFHFEREEEKHLNKNTLFASQYTIMVTNLPPTITEEELKNHFQEAAKSYPIAQMSVAYDNEAEIELCRERGSLIRQKKRLIHEHRYFTTFTRRRYQEEKNDIAGEDAVQTERLKFFRTIREIDNKIKRINKNLTAYGNRQQVPLVAFITFNDDIASNIILDQYNKMSALKYYFGNHRFRIKAANENKSYLLRVYPAPEPSTIIWENLRYRATSRFIRRTISSSVAGLMVFLSIVVTLGAKYFSVTYYNNTGTSGQTCPPGFKSLTKQQQQDLVIQSPDDFTHCYCSLLSDLDQARDHLCRRYLRQRLSAQFFQFFSSVVVLIMNAAIEAITHLTAKFDRHHSEDSRNESVFMRLFVLKYINTGAIFLIDNNYSILQAFFGIKADKSQEFSPTWYQSVGVSILLVQLGNIFTAHGEKFYSYLMYRRRIHRATTDPKTALTQDDLNKVHLGPHFRIAFSYAQILSTLFVIMTFSTGMPLLYVIAAANFFVYYAVEKFMFVRAYRNPPRWSSKVAKQASSLIPVACILHLCMSVWVLTDPALFSSENDSLLGRYVNKYIEKVFGESTNITSRIEDSQSFRLFIFALLIAAFLVIRFLLQFIEKTTNRIFRFFCNIYCCFGKDTNTSLDRRDVTLVTYSRAIQRNLIKGLATYNILQNPQYKEDFGITWQFAVDHDHVRSIRFDQGGAVDEEDDVAKAERLNRQRNNAAGLSVSPHLQGRFFGRTSQAAPNARSSVDGTNRNAGIAMQPPLNNQESFMARQQILLGAGDSHEELT